MLNGVEGAAGIGGDRQGQGDPQHPRGQRLPVAGSLVVMLPVAPIHQKHQQERENVCRQAAACDGGTAFFQIEGGRTAQEKRHQQNPGHLLQQVHQRGFPDPAAGGEVSGDRRTERDAGHGEGGDA